ncbi:hypothetical protein EJ02DRAFT_489365 [Clathrospora elynae]|uniref:Uncharacterized protein n=1 Tax=Clathrospora elynae TaxID=706981 RepID=A0A6A5T5K0_9PLEO|nr:hypothetical protein EJ02DRAFT_489365 [Clathrospora elynae]
MFGALLASKKTARESIKTEKSTMQPRRPNANECKKISRGQRMYLYSHVRRIPRQQFASGCGESCPEPEADKERVTSPETDRTSLCGTQDARNREPEELAEALRRKEITALCARVDETKKQSRGQDERYDALEQKYIEQREQRTKDKMLLDDAFAFYQAMETDSKMAKKTQETLDAHHNEAKEQHRAEMKAKDQARSKLQDSPSRALPVLENINKQELAHMDVELDEAKAFAETKR